MKRTFISALAAIFTLSCTSGFPLVYENENPSSVFAIPEWNPSGLESPQEKLPDPLLFSDGRKVKSLRDWEKRRAEIATMLQFYELGIKPSPERSSIDARMSGDTLTVDVTVGKEVLTLSSVIRYPDEGEGPFPLMIGASMISLPPEVFDGRPIALMNFSERQVTNYGQFGPRDDRGHYQFDRLFPDLTDNGAYIEWAWGFSRIIDALELLGPKVTRIDTKHIGVTGCSYAGKMALMCGAFDQRVALVISQEPGGGGAASWRVSHTLEEVEDLERTDYHWFKESFRDTFSGERVSSIPYDRHELCTMVFPRALLLIGNPDYKWLADESMYVSANAALKVWEHFGVEDRMGWSIQDGHMHCMLPQSQYPEVEAFIDKFLLGIPDVETKVRKAPMFGEVDLSRWIDY